MFDAGAIQAHLDIELGQFDRKLTAAEERVKKFQNEKHVVRLAAVFDNASLGRARQAFAQLDQQLSRDAMQRLRGSPQGSVLGSLNALFSPHPVTGAPSPAQAASQGLLGRVARQTVQGSTVGSGGAAQQQAAQQRALLGGGGGGSGPGFLAGAAAGRAGGGGNQNQGLGTGLFKGIGPGVLGIGTRAATILGLGGAALGALPAVGAIGGAALTAGLGVGALGAGFGIVQKQISPLSQARTQAQAAVASATTPAQAAAAQAKLAQANAEIAKLSPALQSILASETKIQATWEKFSRSLAPLFVGPVRQVATLLNQLTGPLRQMFTGAATLAQPLISSLGNFAKTVLPLLGQAFRVTAPLIAPLIGGLTGLVSGLLPGLISLLKSAGPALNVFAQVMGTLGKDLGTMLTEFAPVIKPASSILKALLDVVSALFPIIGKLAAVFASALAPVFVTFAGVIRSLLPFLTILGKLIASLAGAILTDLVAAFNAVAQLLIAVAPSLTLFANALSGIFTVLENSGVFAILGDALEALVKPLAKLISAFLTGLTPLLPPIIKFISQLSGILIAGLVSAILALLPALTTLINKGLAVLVALLPVLLPLLLTLAGIFTTAVVAAITGVADALAFLINAVPVPVLLALVGAFYAFRLVMLGMAAVKGIILGLRVATLLWQGSTEVAAAKTALAWVASSAVIVASFIAQAAAATAAFIAENLATLGIIAGITLLVAGIIYLATHWKQVWGEVKRLAKDAWEFLTHGWGQLLIPQLYVIRKVVEFVRDHWKQAWTDMQNWARNFWNWLHQVFGVDIGNFFTKTIPSWLDTSVHFLNTKFVQPFKAGLRDSLNWLHRVFGTDISNFFTKTIPGWFTNAVTLIGNAWGFVRGKIAGPIKTVANATIVPLFKGIDAITNFVIGKNPLAGAISTLQGLAAGGKITRGSHETADDVLVRVSRNETVLSAMHSRILAPALAALGVPGYATGGLVNPIGRGLVPERVDMGVDYGGSGALYAIGSGTITNLWNSGWPGGGFIGERLNPPYGSGYWFLAENVVPLINQGIHVGASVHAGQHIADAPGGGPGIEVGWAAPPGTGRTAAAAAGQAATGGDPGAHATAWGVAASNLIGSLGGPRGIVSGKIVGGTAGIGGFIKTLAQIFGGLGNMAKIAIDLAHGDAGGASRALMSLIGGRKSGGAGGQLANTLLSLPGKLIGSAVKFLINMVKGFVNKQQSFGGGTFSGGALGGDANANMHLARQMFPWNLASQWAPFDLLEMHEAGYNRFARNPSSGAYGIPQAYPPTKMPLAAQAAGGSHAGAQLAWMFNYIRSSYGTPAAAWAQYFHHAGGVGSYDKGGPIKEPILGFGMQTGQRYSFGERGTEWVTPAGPGGTGPHGGQLANVLNIMLPEGSTLAQAFTELSFRLRVAQQQGWAGAMPGG